MHRSRSEIAFAQRRFLSLFAKSDFAGIAGCYTEDAQMLASNMGAIEGREAIQAVFKFTALPGHAPYDRGKYIVIWKRIADKWLIHRDMFNTALPRSHSQSASLA